jgi:type IV pilus assembly protein PilO
MAKQKSSGSSLDNLSLAGKIALGLSFVLVVAIGYFVVFYGEIDGNIESARNNLQQQRQQLETAKAADAAYNQDLTELETKRQLELKQRKILPDDSQDHAFLSGIQTVAIIAGVKLTSWTPKDNEPQDFYAKVPMELKLTGRFHQIAKFFHGVSQLDRIINMENIAIKAKAVRSQKDADADDGTDLEVQALATAFRALKGDEKEGGSRRGAKR